MFQKRPLAALRRFLETAFFMLTILAVGSAGATDQIGMYFDEGYQVTDATVGEPNTILTTYLVLKEPSATDGIGGWELRISDDNFGAVTYLGWELEGQALNVVSPPQFVVGLGTPLPIQDAVLLATGQLLVNEVAPVAFSLGHVNQASIPGEMAYISGGDPAQLIPMTTVTGNPEVAWINRNVPIGVVSPAALNFGEVPLGLPVTQNVVVSNIGGGILYLDLTLDGNCEDFSLLPDLRFPQHVGPGGSLTIPVTFEPTTLGFQECLLSLGSEFVQDVPLTGIGREPIVDWEFSGNPDFGTVPVGNPELRSLTVTNTGEDPFELDASMLSPCEVFTIQNPGPVILDIGASHTLHVIFTPVDPIPYACDLDLGGNLGTIGLTGTGREAIFGYEVTPLEIVFPVLAAPASSSAVVTLVNTGEVPIEVNPVILSGNETFLVFHETGPTVVEPDQELSVLVQMNAELPGTFTGVLGWTNDAIAEVPITAEVVEAIPECIVSPEEINFGLIPFGQAITHYASVQNTGNVPLEMVLDSSCPNLTFNPSAFTLQPGQVRSISFTYLGTETGPFECLVSFGESHCSPLVCFGEVGEAPNPNEDLVGIFFDTEFNQNLIELNHGYQMVESYLVLMNPSATDGVAAWECRVATSNDQTTLVGHEIMGGEFLNLTTPPVFTIGLGAPIPYAQNIHLATFQFMVGELYEDVFLELYPTWQASIPGQMAYVSGGADPYLVAMQPHTGVPQVAFITGYAVGVGAPPPDLMQNGGRVELVWSVDSDQDAQYNVYRRGSTGAAEAINNAPLQAVGGEVRYNDTPEGFAEGDVLHYSYGVVRDGQEILRSGETEITLAGLPLLSTRLLPNVPNPFNPQTEVRFVMGEAGHARVTVYDVSGRLVATLADETRGAGEHALLWQGRDQSGRQLPSGAYYLRLESEGRVDHRKIMLLK